MWFEFLCIRRYYSLYSSVPNRRAGQNKHAGGKILKKNIKCAGQNRGAGGKFSGKSINMQRENLQFFHQQTGVSISRGSISRGIAVFGNLSVLSIYSEVLD